ncbi:MAG: hypothetical protein K2O39_02850, partial [Clostridiales bacterium]|nr:hypothetical protein [Clostridiales bacterium]
DRDYSKDDPLDWFRAFLKWLKENWKWLLSVILSVGTIIVALVVFSPFLPIIVSGLFAAVKVVGHCVLWLLKGLLWLISAPFRLIVHLIAGGD